MGVGSRIGGNLRRPKEPTEDRGGGAGAPGVFGATGKGLGDPPDANVVVEPTDRKAGGRVMCPPIVFHSVVGSMGDPRDIVTGFDRNCETVAHVHLG